MKKLVSSAVIFASLVAPVLSAQAASAPRKVYCALTQSDAEQSILLAEERFVLSENEKKSVILKGTSSDGVEIQGKADVMNMVVRQPARPSSQAYSHGYFLILQLVKAGKQDQTIAIGGGSHGTLMEGSADLVEKARAIENNQSGLTIWSNSEDKSYRFTAACGFEN